MEESDQFTILEQTFANERHTLTRDEHEAIFAKDRALIPQSTGHHYAIVHHGDIRAGQTVKGDHNWLVITGDIQDGAEVSLRSGLLSARDIGNNVELMVDSPIIVSAEAAEALDSDGYSKLVSWCRIRSVSRGDATLVAVPEAKRGRLVQYFSEVRFTPSLGSKEVYEKLWWLVADEKDMSQKDQLLYAGVCKSSHLLEWRKELGDMKILLGTSDFFELQGEQGNQSTLSPEMQKKGFADLLKQLIQSKEKQRNGR